MLTFSARLLRSPRQAIHLSKRNVCPNKRDHLRHVHRSGPLLIWDWHITKYAHSGTSECGQLGNTNRAECVTC